MKCIPIFLLRALEGIKETDAQKRLDTEANHIAWITGSVVAGRYMLAKSFGIDLESTTGDLFKDNKGIIADADTQRLMLLKKIGKKSRPCYKKL
jgi:hypothetical protein